MNAGGGTAALKMRNMLARALHQRQSSSSNANSEHTRRLPALPSSDTSYDLHGSRARQMEGMHVADLSALRLHDMQVRFKGRIKDAALCWSCCESARMRADPMIAHHTC